MGKRRGPSVMVSALAAIFIASGCSSGTSETGEGGAASAEACSVLAELVPLRTIEGDPPPAWVADDNDLEAPLHAALAPGGRNITAAVVALYLHPGNDDDLDMWADQVGSRPGVAIIDTRDLEASYEEFVRLFSGQPDMVDAVRAEDLPASVWAEADDAAAARSLEEWALDQDDIYEVMVHGPDDPRWDLLFWGIDSAADRNTWREMADLLDSVDGSPEWSTTYADLIRESMEVGPARLKGSEAFEQANEKFPPLQNAIAACGF